MTKLKPKILTLSSSCVWDEAHHNAFTDLIYFKGFFYLAFREASSHEKQGNGKIRILKSKNASNWKSVALLKKRGLDLRDPKLSITPLGELLLSVGGSIYKKSILLGFNPVAAISNDGMIWSPFQNLNITDEWPWKVTWYKGIGYSASYRCSNFSDLKKPWYLTLLQTLDGLNFQPITALNIAGFPSETTLRFLQDGTMVALVRRRHNGWIGHAKPPYTSWKWNVIDKKIGGPNFLILPDGTLWAASRYYVPQGKNKWEYYTAIAQMTLSTYKVKLILPSGGDTSYPGLVFHQGILYVSYYSSHENKTAIYVSKIIIT